MNEVLKSLIEAPESINPALVMQQRVKSESGSVTSLIAMKPAIEKAIKQGQEEVREVSRACKSLVFCDAVPAGHVPEGF